MAFTKYTWGKASSPTPVVPLVAPIDPEHLNPTAEVDIPVGNPLWVADTSAPTLPDTLIGDLGGGPIGGGGPIDHTPGQTAGASPDPVGQPPARSEHGVGVGPGLTVAESQGVRGALMGEDLGAYAQHRYVPTTDRTDGPGPQLAVLYDTPGDGDSPATLQYQRTGVGQPNDPDARTGRREKRWWERVIDMHWYDASYRPMVAKTARTAQPQPAVQNGNQLTSPYPSSADSWSTFGTPDSFTGPQLRRSPVPWDQPLTTDGIGGGAPVNEAGLTVWGL